MAVTQMEAMRVWTTPNAKVFRHACVPPSASSIPRRILHRHNYSRRFHQAPSAVVSFTRLDHQNTTHHADVVAVEEDFSHLDVAFCGVAGAVSAPLNQ